MSVRRSQPSRTASPTPTAFSGISNYRTESYRPKGNAPAVPPIDYRQVSLAHFQELSSFLVAYLARSSATSRTTARQKLTRLTIQQFHELSTDVYDELVRRKKDGKEVPFLPVREEFHPKRNQARQKLATLPTSRFEDLSSDVYYELARRYPEFAEDPNGNPSNADSDYPVSDFPTASPPRVTNTSRISGRASVDRPSDSGYGSHGSRRPSEDQRRPDYSGRRSEDTYNPGRSSEDGGYAQSIMSSRSNRRKPSQDTGGRRSEDTQRENPYSRRQASVSESTTTVSAQQSSTATIGMVTPNKSTMEEEYIEVPYGRDQRESGSSINPDEGVQSLDVLADADDSASEYQSPGLGSPGVGLRGLNARLKNMDDDSGEDSLGERFGRTSVGSDRSGSGRFGGRTSLTTGDSGKMKQEYELKIAMMQTQISQLQREAGGNKVAQLEEELSTAQAQITEHASTVQSLQNELEDLKESRQRDKNRESRRTQSDEDELQILRERCERLETERQRGGDLEAVEQLRSDMEGLLQELEDLSKRNDELMSAKDADHQIIRDLDSQMKDYKRKYEQAKTELRSIKATSQLFLQAPKLADDQLPVAADGGILDIHMTSFLTGVDSLVTAARSNAPTRVLAPMKSIVNAVSLIVEDVRAFEKRPSRDRSDIDIDALKALRERAESTLSNLVAASKTHATSSGMSPVSLLDAAASHVSVTMTDLARTVCLRRATKAEQEQFASYSPAPSATQGFSPALRSVDELGGGNGQHSRKSSGPTARFADTRTRRQTPSEHSSSDKTNSPPPIFERAPRSRDAMNGDEVPVASDGVEDNWAELKPYLEAQTESIVYAIQAVLSGVRSPTPSPNLNENLSQIITIVTSIVAVCKDNLPPASSQQGTEILRELSDHASRLSEVQDLPEVTKESRQTMAKSSFAVANAMKGLMKL